MFFNTIYLFFIKKNVLKRLTNVSSNGSGTSIKKVAVILDEKLSGFKNEIKETLVRQNIIDRQITFITYKSKLNKGEIPQFDEITPKDINSSGVFHTGRMNWYLETKFDLLINFYDEANPIMMMFTQLTKADFKVGFATTDKRLNHLVINTKSKDVSVFMDELIKYLQILKKI
jgi:hypothetical protein